MQLIESNFSCGSLRAKFSIPLDIHLREIGNAIQVRYSISDFLYV